MSLDLKPQAGPPTGEENIQESLVKYKRVTARLKEVLEDTKKELLERDQQLKALEAQHNSASAAGLWRLIEEEEAAGLPGCRVCDVVARVNPEVLAGGEGTSGSSWCYVLGKGTGGAVRWRGWVQESDLIKHAPDVALPASLSSTRDAVDQKTALQAAQSGLTAVQEEFRKYRIRSETLLRQKDSEIEALGSRSGGADASAIAVEVERIKAEYAAYRRRAVDMLREKDEALAQCEQRGGPSVPTSSSVSPGDAPKYQPSLITAAIQSSEKSGTAPALPPSETGVDEAVTAELERLKAEYATYRRRAIEMLKEKDDQLQKSSDQIRTLTALSASSSGYAHSASLAPPPSSRSSVHSDGDSSSWKVDTLASEATREYLKNILLRYLSSHDAQVRAQLEAAIAAIMEFTPAEISRVQAARLKSSSGFWGLLGK